NMPARSVAFLESHMSSDQKQPEKSILLDESFSAIENSPEWRGFWKREHYNGLERAISEIEFYVSRGKAQEAAASLGDINSSYRNTQGARYASSIYFMATGKMQEAVSLLESLVSEEPSNMKYLGKLAEVQMTTGNYAGATNTLSKILELGTSDATILYSRAESYRKTSEYDKALSDINTYLGMYPSDRKAISLAGHIKADSGDNLEAIRLFSDNIKQNPGDPAVYLDRADSYFVGKAWTMAINDYAMSLDLEPENGDAWLSKGLALYNIGKQEDACIHFRKALSLGNKRASGFISRYCIK
ncbi:MAG: tetratricopeptide repeat protein, partial [Bacteroidales bacterium]